MACVKENETSSISSESVDDTSDSDSLEDYISFISNRNSSSLEESISLNYPNTNCPLTLSTLLQEEDLVPLFDGAGWAGTRVWSAAIWGLKYIVDTHIIAKDKSIGKLNHNDSYGTNLSLCELGCGLGVPGMVWHVFGGNVVLTEQESIMSQLKLNLKNNFPQTFISNENVNALDICHNAEHGNGRKEKRIEAHTLDWSRKNFLSMLRNTGYSEGFDIVINCDCIFEQLYGKSWERLIEVIDECLRVNPKTLVVTSVERRTGDGIDDFVKQMECSSHVGSVVKELIDDNRNLELYVTKGRK
mmetsp:Transcript_7143/g.10244  ORF Transcript_7143/g.10244 Transcript_7143/m.10244 type:complete len:301 (-) Transcript_7143:98-1000(-)